MDPVLVVSPHLDDAVLSLGQFLHGWPGATVLTIFAGIPNVDEPATTFDVNCGFTSAREAVVNRLDEDDRALHLLKSRVMRSPYFDGQYQNMPTKMNVALTILKSLRATRARRMIGPVGLAHPDHQFVAESFLLAAKIALTRGVQCWLYEELPARVLWPELVIPALDKFCAEAMTATLDFIGTGDVIAKEQAVGCYRSQMWALDGRCLYVPERVWNLCIS